MRKLKLSFFLPAMQLLLAVSLLYWGAHERTASISEELYVSPATLICFGINAPALLLRALGAWLGMPHVNRASTVVLGFGLEDWFFLFGVVVCWYLLGRWLDHLRSRDPQGLSQRFSPGSLFLNLLLIACGAVLGFLAVRGGQRWSSTLGLIIEKTLFLIWSAFLILAPSMKLVRRSRKPVDA